MPGSSFSFLCDGNLEKDSLLQLAAQQCQVPIEQIEDIYPCTAAQEGLFALSVKSLNAYIARYIYTLPRDTNITRFRDAIVATLDAHTILRTRLIQASEHGTLQVVVRQGVEISSSDNWNTYLASDSQQQMPPGAPLIRVGIIEGQEQTALVITIHHALYDDWSLNVVLKDIERAYDGTPLAPRVFADFTAHSLSAQSEDSAHYWRSQLGGASASRFPRLPSDSYIAAARGSMITQVPFAHIMTEAEQSAVIELGWALLVAQSTGSLDVTFGVTLTGRREPLPGIGDMSGPTIATVPFRVHLSPTTRVTDALESLLSKADEMLPFEQRGLYHIGHLGSDTAAACQFQTLVVIQSPPQYQYKYLRETTQDHDLLNHATFGTYPLTLVCDLAHDSVRVQAVYDDQVIPVEQMQRILDQFRTILVQIAGVQHDDASMVLSRIESVSARDLQELKHWNGQVPPKVDICMHDLILEQCRSQPGSPAVCAWDGGFTYGEIDDLSLKLATHLSRSHGVGPEVFVPVYFEKSKWTTVAILAVMRAGAAFVLLDPSTPLSRNETVCRKVNALCVLSSISLAASAGALADTIIPIGAEAKVFQPTPNNNNNNSATEESELSSFSSSSNALYAVFTSGSTGAPKGVIIENAAFATSTKSYIQTGQMTQETRALQFASYAFDVSISDTLVTLTAGGCICVPSEEERKAELAQVVAKYGINWADFTPSLLRQLSPDQMPSLRVIVLGGEPMSQAEIEIWSPHVRLLNIYGPAECCVLSTIQANITRATDPRDIGYGTGCVCWVTNPIDPNTLMPIGAVGELLIEGPTVGRGYLGDEEKTCAAFIASPSWMELFRPADTASRLYRTGDLVQYTNEGSLRYVGRRDMQVKLRGQRIELEEVEYHILACYPDADEVVVDVVSLEGRQEQLVAFVSVKGAPVTDTLAEQFLRATAEFHHSVATVEALLRQRVPTYMVPSVFFPVSHMLRTVSDKTDRRRLRQAVQNLTREQIESYRRQPRQATKRPPVSESARIASSEGGIGLDDGFFQLGGDSITAMKVAAIAKSQGLALSIPDLFRPSSTLEVIINQSIETATSRQWDWAAEATPSPNITACNVSLSARSRPTRKRIGLTGSTGFLGKELLRQLNEHPDVPEIHCLAVRENGAGVARKSPLLQSPKITIHAGDLSLPNLGMPADTFARILQDCDSIIHCGADISFVQPYELLKAANVGATQELARVAAQFSIPLHYISSAALSHFTGLDNVGEISMLPYPPPSDGEQGYLTSKWVSEIYLENCSRTHNIPLTIHRISSIVGPDAPAMDITNNVLGYSRQMRAVPNLRGCRGFVDLIPVDVAAANIVAEAVAVSSETALIRYVNESGETQVAASQLKGHLEQAAEESFQEMTLAQWIQSAQEHGMPELVARFLRSMPPEEIDIAMPLLTSSRIRGTRVMRN
ncbi:hypothetical protein AOCH_002450 [Aspergillus ochraceoroseus]|uniref:Carrier domain-containing protein n=1 Tax=Aspergillus ochraceoroseus TaxID=138278 RepID=A0A0F8X183_9EURO|nr:hypothetical protein AOCH_002450 [Aspergillus ochraceoroseus]